MKSVEQLKEEVIKIKEIESRELKLKEEKDKIISKDISEIILNKYKNEIIDFIEVEVIASIKDEKKKLFLGISEIIDTYFEKVKLEAIAKEKFALYFDSIEVSNEIKKVISDDIITLILEKGYKVDKTYFSNDIGKITFSIDIYFEKRDYIIRKLIDKTIEKLIIATHILMILIVLFAFFSISVLIVQGW